jgi:hypothetical protein
MPKYQIAETLRVKLIVDDETANGAIEQYMKDFLLLFNSQRKIQCMEGSDFTVHLVNEDGSIGYEVDPAESDSKDGV